MRRAPSCLVVAAFLSLAPIACDGAWANGVLSTPAAHRSAGPLPTTRQATTRRITTGRELGAASRGWAGNRHVMDRRLRSGPRRLAGPYSTLRHRHSRIDRRGFAPGRPWLWPYGDVIGDEAPVRFDDGPAQASRPAPIPSVADLPVSAGIRSVPAAAPTVYVVNHGRRSQRGVAKILTAGEGDDEAAPSQGPRIISVTVPRGR